MSSWEIFSTHAGASSVKWTHYFPIYDRHFSNWRNRTLTFLEVGVLNGGSGSIWGKFFGPKARIIGLDIDPKCIQHQTDQYQIRIGDQSNPNFLQSVIEEFGVPDVVLDDGSHQQDHIYSTFSYLYPKMHLNSIYMIEDLHTSYWSSHKGGLDNSNSFMNKTKSYLDQLNLQHNGLKPDSIVKDTFSISVYDSIVVFEKGKPYKKDHVFSGQLK